MNQGIRFLNGVATAGVEMAWALCWQAAVVVAAFAILAWICRRAAPSFRCWIWRIAAFKLLLMPFWNASVGWNRPPWVDPRPGVAAVSPAPDPNPGAGRHGPGAVESDRLPARPASPGGERPEPVAWQVGLIGAWGLLLVVQGAGLLRQRRRLTRLLDRAIPAADPSLLALVAASSLRVGLQRPPLVLMGLDGVSPFVCRPLRPTLVLPSGLAESLPGESLRPILIHELTHLRRHDLWWNWVETVARLVYVIHPAAFYVAFRVRLEGELACDQAAMILTDQGAAGYAATLVEVVALTSCPLARVASLAGADAACP